MFKVKEPMNTLTHFVGIPLSIVGLIWMLMRAIEHKSAFHIVGALIFGLSLIGLYSASTVYHWISGSEKLQLLLRKIDHTMIYILIAGTYTPICLVTLKGPLGWILLSLVWLMAIVGIVFKFLWMNAPRWLYTGFYLILGWIAIFFIVPLYHALPTGGFIWLLVGGMFYTIGSVIYASKSSKLKISVFEFHEIFHMFILCGSIAHFILVNNYLLA